MIYVVMFTALLLFMAGLLWPFMKWPKWLAYASLVIGAIVGVSELFLPDPLLGARPVREALAIAGLITVFWWIPAICYATARVLHWAFIGQRMTGRREAL